MDLDDLLERSAPPTAPRTADLERELHQLVADAESAVRPARRGLRMALAGTIATVVIGAGTGAGLAVGLVPTPRWVPWSTPSGAACEFQFTVSSQNPDHILPRPPTVPEADRQRAVAEARRFLESFDYSSIDEAAAVREFQKEQDAAIASQPDPSERQPRLQGDDLVVSAVNSEVVDRLHTHLTAEGLEPRAVAIEIARTC